MDTSEFGLPWLLSPMDPAQFLADYWEKQPLALLRHDEGYFGSVLTLADMDRILSSNDLRFPAVQLFKNNVQVTPPEYTTEMDTKVGPAASVVDLVKLFAHYQQGATVVIDSLDRSWMPLARLCAGMERAFSHPTQTNVYLTPPSSQGFGAHYDTHDVFILQMAGSKRWRLYRSPVQLPLADNPSPRPGPDPGAPIADFVLRAGDVLYIPRGHVHDAATTDSVSLHVTLGINTYTWADLFMEALNNLCRRDVRFRRGLPLGFAVDGAAAARVRAEGAALSRALADGVLPVEETAEALAERFIRTRLPLFDGHLIELSEARRLTPQTRVRKRAWLYRLMIASDSVHLLYHGKGLKFARSLEGPLHFILENETFEVTSLPGNLNDRDKVTLVQLLIDEGLLTIDSTPATNASSLG
jgi:ribosomal protein L16 Arg81 hydroxylase